MTFLLDTNILSEFVKPSSDPKVIKWVKKQTDALLFISVISIAELERGIEKLPESRKKNQLTVWKADLLEKFKNQTLGVNIAVANEWGRIVANSEKAGYRMEAPDGLIAATASVHRLTIVTRNTKDFHITGLPLLNPFE